MRIKTITCHDVYNVGASLQAYALQKYLSDLGHDVQIIDYKPDYLSRHYSLTSVNNPKYNKPLLREIYIILKLKNRIKALKSEKKKAFDQFKEQYLNITEKRYLSFDNLKKDCPEADIYIAGSDQIWNPLFPNGKDPSFFLDFVPDHKIKASYAASFAVEQISEEDKERDKKLLDKFDYISVRESSALDILKSMNLIGSHVCDPVFLLNSKDWERIIVPFNHTKKYIFVYDFDSNNAIHDRIKSYASKNDLDIVSAFPFDGGKCIQRLGPREFLGVINCSELVVSNSFHATAFSIIFHKPFMVFNRQEKINARMNDLIQYFGIDSRTILNPINDLPSVIYDWTSIEENMKQFVNESKEFLSRIIEGR